MLCTLTPMPRSLRIVLTLFVAILTALYSARIMSTAARGSVWFISHGVSCYWKHDTKMQGPPTIFETTSTPYLAWAKLGPQVLATKPKALIVVSAHWEAPSYLGRGVQINNDSSNPLIHDFFGFPKEYYELKFHSRAEASVVDHVKNALRGKLKVDETPRGLDHGIYFPFMVMFGHENRQLPPIVQVSLPGNPTPEASAELGDALADLRDQGYAIISTGQVVHNLRDYMTGQNGSYGAPFTKAVSSAALSSSPRSAAIDLFKHPYHKRAHPTPEHLLPFVVAAAAAQNGRCQELFTLADGALGWGIWRWD